MGKKIGIFIADTMNVVDTWYAYNRFMEEGWTPYFVGTQGKYHYSANISNQNWQNWNQGNVHGMHNMLASGSIQPDWTVQYLAEQISVDDFDAVYVGDGYGVDHFMGSEATATFFKNFFKIDKPIGLLGRAPHMLSFSDWTTKNMTVTSHPSVRNFIAEKGHEWVDKGFVANNNIFTCRSWWDSPEFFKNFLTYCLKR